MPEFLCQSTDRINWKFYEVCGYLKWFSRVKSQYALSQCQHVPPYIRFEGVVELCSRLWLVVAVRQRDKRKGSIAVSTAVLDRVTKTMSVARCWWTTWTTRSKRRPTCSAQLHLPTHDLFWANLRVQLHLPPLRSLDLAWNPSATRDTVRLVVCLSGTAVTITC